MRLSIYLIGLCVLIILAGQSNAFASEDFQIRPPIFGLNVEFKDSEMNMTQLDFESKLQTQTQTKHISMDIQRRVYTIYSPLMYASFGMQTEATWFDRRVNWSAYSVKFNFEAEHIGLRYQGNMSSAGRDDFELFDTRLDVYGFWRPGFLTESGSELARIGGGLSYFDCDPYQGQTFLNDQNFAAFVSMYYVFTEIKFVMLINDDVWNGGLVEMKLFNPLNNMGVHAFDPDFHYNNLLFFFSSLFPFEVGLTGAFDMPNEADGWGWYIKARYNILWATIQTEKKNMSMGFEIYWSYRDGINNTQVSGGWEFGIKFTIFGF